MHQVKEYDPNIIGWPNAMVDKADYLALEAKSIGEVQKWQNAAVEAQEDRAGAERSLIYCARINIDLMKRNRELEAALRESKRSHVICEDCWYSCPKSGECCNHNEGPECNCGADEWNAKIDALLTSKETKGEQG